MTEGWLETQGIAEQKINVHQILELAKQSYENYLIRSNEKDLDVAANYYLKALKIDPSLPEAHYRLAGLLWEKGNIDINSALEQCEKAAALDPDSSTARLYLGYFLKAAGRFDEAEKEFKSSIKLDGFLSAKPRIALGTMIIKKNKCSVTAFPEFARGIYYFISGIIMLSRDFNALKMLYKSLEEDVKFLSYKSRGKIQAKFKNYDKALKIYEDAAKKIGKEDVFYSEIANLLLKKGNHAQACKYYKNAVKAFPSNLNLWTNLVNILQAYYKDNTDELIRCYSNMTELEPDNAAFCYELGYLYLKTDEKISAVNSFKRAADLESDNAFYCNSYAYALVQLEDYDEAIIQYQKAIRLNPDNKWTSMAAQALGAIYYQVKFNVDAAITAYQTAIALNPSNADAFVAIGEIHQERNNLASAISNYCAAIKINPAISKAYCNMGAALGEKGYVDEAIIAYQKATALDSGDAVAFNNLGLIFLEWKQKPLDALVKFTEAIESNPNYAPAYYNKGRAYDALNNKIQAAKYYQMAIDINKFTNEIDESKVENRLYDLFEVSNFAKN